MLTITNHQGSVNENHKEASFHPSKKDNYQNIFIKGNKWKEMWREGTLAHHW
jgi:hypothetical protein